MKNKMKIVRIPANKKNVILLPDLHVPNHDAQVLYLAKKYGRDHEADVIVLTGDVIDSAAFGRHGHKPKDEDIKKYFDQTIEILKLIRSEFPDALIYWTEGNHDLWFARYLQANARVLQHDPYFSIQQRLRLNEVGIEYLHEDTVLKYGDHHILHGHQFFKGKYQGDNPSKSVFNLTGVPTIIGHVHRRSFWDKKTITGKIVSCYSTGCISELSPGYNPFSNYAHGFAHLYKKKGRVIFRNLIIDKEILF